MVRPAGDDSSSVDTLCEKCAKGYYLTVAGSATTHGVCKTCGPSLTDDAETASTTGSPVFADTADGILLGCTKCREGYYLTVAGASGSAVAGTCKTCGTSLTNGVAVSALNGEDVFADTAAGILSGCTKCAANHRLSAVGGSGTAAGTCTACAAGSVNAANDD